MPIQSDHHSSKAGFKLTRRLSLQPHYARTLDHWAAALEAHQCEAIAIKVGMFAFTVNPYSLNLTGALAAFL